MKIAVITANLGDFDPKINNVEQSVPYDFYRFTDENFPPRHKAMTPRLQARIVKMFGWQMVPGYDYYIWVDSSLVLSHRDSVRWFIDQCDGVDMAVFKHPERNTIQQEADFLKERLNRNDPYIVSRYENELIDPQLAEIKADKSFADQNLFASSAFVYKNNPKVQNVMFHWWYHTSRYHTIDQLSLPYILFKQNCTVRIIPDSYLKVPYLKHVRNTKDQIVFKEQVALKEQIAFKNEMQPLLIETQKDKVEESPYQGELKFWRDWLEGNGKAYERSGRLSDRFTPLIGHKKEITIANLGAGPMCLIGNWRRDVKVNVISSDLLADEYTKMRAELNLRPQYIVEKQDMENLTYENNKFDIVYCANALDHTQNPRKALNEMVRICKPGGYIYLRHIAHEGKRHNYRNLHKWNIDATENDDCRFWSDWPEHMDKGFLLSDIYQGFKTTVELIPKGALITSFVQKT